MITILILNLNHKPYCHINSKNNYNGKIIKKSIIKK